MINAVKRYKNLQSAIQALNKSNKNGEYMSNGLKIKIVDNNIGTQVEFDVCGDASEMKVMVDSMIKAIESNMALLLCLIRRDAQDLNLFLDSIR